MPAIIAAGAITGQIVGAKIASNAAKKAGQTQAASADKAQGYNQQVFDYQKQITQPYIQNGQTSLQNLMSQHWGGSPQSYGAAPPPMGMPQGGRPLGGFGQPQGGGMVRLKAPTGEVGMVPARDAQRLMAAGAQRIG